MIHTVKGTQRARYPVVTYSATGAPTQVVLVETRGTPAHPLSPTSSHPQMYFRVPTARVPVVPKEVLELPCHETQDGRRWGWWHRNDRLQLSFCHTEHFEQSVRTTGLFKGKGFRRSRGCAYQGNWRNDQGSH